MHEKHVYAWHKLRGIFATALQEAALNSTPPRSSFSPLVVSSKSSVQNSDLSNVTHMHTTFVILCVLNSHWHWALARPLSGAPLRALAAARRAPLARLIMCAPSRGLRLGLRSHTRFDVAPAAHMQHSYSPISSISQGGLRFMQPGHTP